MHLNWLFHVSSAKGVILTTPGVGPASSGGRQGSVFSISPCSCYLTPSDPAPWCPSGPHLLLACLCPTRPTCRNRILVIAIVFQVCIGCFLCYCPGMPNIFNFMPIR